MSPGYDDDQGRGHGSARDDAPRTEAFRGNRRLEELLDLLRRPLGAAEALIHAEVPASRRPVVLVVGCARTGSTLLLQLLAESGALAYPSNFLSRFTAAPVLGSLLQKMLFDPAYGFRDELRLHSAPAAPYRSQLGKTEGALSPHDFQGFWRRWVREVDGRPPTTEEAGAVAFDEIQADLLRMTAVFDRPLALKAHILNWMLPAVAEGIPDGYIVFLRRDPFFTAQSLLEARRAYFGSFEPWYSFKPPEFDSLARLAPEAQVVGQVLGTERAIEAGIRGLPRSRVIEVSYEELTSSPPDVWQSLVQALATHPGCPDLGECPRVEPFESGNVERLPHGVLASIRSALDALGE